jgi:hypothetical protein
MQYVDINKERQHILFYFLKSPVAWLRFLCGDKGEGYLV